VSAARRVSELDAILKLANDETRILRGHGQPLKKTDVTSFRAMLIDARSRVAAQVARGATEAEAIAAKPLKEIDASINSPPGESDPFVRIIYRSLKAAS